MLKLLASTMVIIVAIGMCIGLTASGISIVEGQLFSLRYSLVMTLLWPCCKPKPDHAGDLW